MVMDHYHTMKFHLGIGIPKVFSHPDHRPTKTEEEDEEYDRFQKMLEDREHSEEKEINSS